MEPGSLSDRVGIRKASLPILRSSIFLHTHKHSTGISSPEIILKKSSTLIHLKSATHNHQNSFSSKITFSKKPSQVPSSKSIIKEDLSEFFPEWLTMREDFQKKFNEMAMNECKDLSTIVQTPSHSRSEDEKRVLCKWLSESEFMKNMPQIVVRELSEHLHCKRFKKDESILTKGAEPDCIYIVYKGSVGIYLERERIAHCDSGNYFGDVALDKHSLRTADAKADSDNVILFTIQDIDYKCIVYSYKNLEKHSNLKLLINIPYFSCLSYAKVQNLINGCAACLFNPGDVIYDNNSKSHSFYVIKSGTVELQIYIDIEKVNKWPTGTRSWNVRKVMSKYVYPLKVLKEGDYFGEYEILNKSDRKTRAVAVKNTFCLALSCDELEKSPGFKTEKCSAKVNLEYSSAISELEEKFRKDMRKSSVSNELLCNSINKNTKRAEKLKETFTARKELEYKMLKQRRINNVLQDNIKELKETFGVFTTFEGNIVKEKLYRDNKRNVTSYFTPSKA